MNEEQFGSEMEFLLSCSDDISMLFEELSQAEINNDKLTYEKIYKVLKEQLQKEEKDYKRLSTREVTEMMDMIDASTAYDSLDNINEKFTILSLLSLDFRSSSNVRFKSLLKDNYLIKNKKTKFIETDYYDFEDDEQEIFCERRLNTYLVESLLFNDLLELFICNLNTYINLIANNEIKETLIKYKYIVVNVFGKNNLELLNKNKSLENTYLYSKLLYDVLEKTDAGLIFNYNIIKTDYLSKSLYNFLETQHELVEPDPTQQLIYQILDIVYVDSVNLLFQEDKKTAYSIYKDTLYKFHNKKYLETAFNYDKKIKVLTLNK